MTKSAQWWTRLCDLHGNLGGDVSHENTPQGHTRTTKVHFFHINKWEKL